jgi:hypothetical protein
MALSNLGFTTNPQDLNARLTRTKSYTNNGWLIWDGIRRVTDGRAVATFHDKVDAETIDQCMATAISAGAILPAEWTVALGDDRQARCARLSHARSAAGQ